MLDNKKRREILEAARAADYQGSVLDLFEAARQGQDVSQIIQPMQVAQTPQEQQVGLRQEHAQGNTGASMAFPNVPPNTSFNTKGMKAPINISKFDEQGHLVQSFKNVPPGIENLPTGPGKGTVIETPAYKKGGIYIKPENRGKFTAWAKARDLSVRQAANRVMANTDKYPPRVVKMANFAKNFAK